MLASTRGAALPNSITLKVSGFTGVAGTCTPLTMTVWPSLDDTAMSARAGSATAAAIRQARVNRYMLFLPLGLSLVYANILPPRAAIHQGQIHRVLE